MRPGYRASGLAPGRANLAGVDDELDAGGVEGAHVVRPVDLEGEDETWHRAEPMQPRQAARRRTFDAALPEAPHVAHIPLLAPREAVAVAPVEGGGEPGQVAEHPVVGAAEEELARAHARRRQLRVSPARDGEGQRIPDGRR